MTQIYTHPFVALNEYLDAGDGVGHQVVFVTVMAMDMVTLANNRWCDSWS